MPKLHSNTTSTNHVNEGGDVNEFDEYFPLEIVETAPRFSDSYTEIQSAIYAHIAEHPDEDVSMDALAQVAAEVDRNDVRNLAYGAALALRNLALIDFDTLNLVARKRM